MGHWAHYMFGLSAGSMSSQDVGLRSVVQGSTVRCLCAQWPKVLNAPLSEVDPELEDIIEHEKNRQWKVRGVATLLPCSATHGPILVLSFSRQTGFGRGTDLQLKKSSSGISLGSILLVKIRVL